MKKELFRKFGWWLLVVVVVYSVGMRVRFGRGLPSGVEQWLAEMYVGFLFVSALAFFAVGRYIDNVRAR